jgi:hypothetical protein
MANALSKEKARSDFLIAMYNQMMNDINRHIVVVWQSVSVLVGAFAAWSLIEKKIISLDMAATLIVIIAIWVVAHVYDAAYWYNRNLVIIANIERQFLTKDDLKEIHYYFGAHRSKTSMLTHLKLQMFLALGVAALVLGIQFFDRVWPALPDVCAMPRVSLVPWLTALIGIGIWYYRRNLAQRKYAEFLKNSPGKSVDASGITFGVGHPTDPAEEH